MLTTVFIAVVVAVLLLWGVAIYNRLVRLRALVKEGFSGITVQLRRRADLVPNLVSTADNAFTGMLGRLLAVAEAYPDLKADDNFRQLQSELSEIEEQLQGARRYYNATVRDLNTRIQSFPDVLFARPLGFTEAEFYQDGDASIQQVPKVEFGTAKA